MTYTLVVNRTTATHSHGYAAAPELSAQELELAKELERARTQDGDSLEFEVLENR